MWKNGYEVDVFSRKARVPTQVQVGVDGEVIFEVGTGVTPTLATTGTHFGSSFGAKSGGGFWASLGSYAHTSSYYPGWYTEKRYRVLNLEQELAANQQLTWQQVNDLYTHIHDEHYTLGALPAALIGLTATFLTQGAGASLMGSVMGSGSTAATGAAASTAVSAGATAAATSGLGFTFATGALQEAISYSASLTAMNMANGVMNGELANPVAGFSVRNLAVQMVSIGATDALSGCDMLKDLQASLTLEEDTRRLLAGITAHTAAQSAIGGEDLGRALLYNAVSQTATWQMGRWMHGTGIAYKHGKIANAERYLRHAFAGAASGAITGAILDREVMWQKALSGAVGAISGELIGDAFAAAHEADHKEFDALSDNPELVERGVYFAQMGAAVGAGLFGLDPEIAGSTGGLAAEKNAFFIPLIMVGLAAYEAYETYNIYQKEGPVAALKHAGFALAVGVAGGAAVKVTAKVGGKFITKAYPSAEAAWRAVLADNPLLGRVVAWVSEKGSRAFEKVAAADAAASRAILAPVVKKLVVKAERVGIEKTFKSLSGKIYETPVEWTAPVGTKQTYRVWQRTDIDWRLVRTKGEPSHRGKTNLQAAREHGIAPQMTDGKFARIHHTGQRNQGPLVEATSRLHGDDGNAMRILHNQFPGKSKHPEFPVDHGKWGRERSSYWKWRAENVN